MFHFDQDVSELVYQLQQGGSPDVLMVHNLLKVVLSPKVFTQAGKPLERQILLYKYAQSEMAKNFRPP